MRKIKLMMSIVVLAMLLASCATSSLGIRTQSSYLELEKEDLEITKRMTAEATSTRILGIDFNRLFAKKSATHTWRGYAPTIFGSALDYNYDQNKALYKLLKENPDYDVIMYPRFERKVRRFLFFFSVTETKVSARMEKLKEEDNKEQEKE